MTKKELHEIVKSRWDGVSTFSICVREGSVVLQGTKYIHTTLYTPNSNTLRRQHNLRVKSLWKFEKWLKEICEELDRPFQTNEAYTGRGHPLELVQE